MKFIKIYVMLMNEHEKSASDKICFMINLILCLIMLTVKNFS